MIALADASDIPLWGWHGWALFTLTAALIAAAVWLFLAILHAPLMDPEPDALDVLDGIERCTYTTCHASVTTHVHAGYEWWPMCEEHGVPYLTQDMRKGSS